MTHHNPLLALVFLIIIAIVISSKIYNKFTVGYSTNDDTYPGLAYFIIIIIAVILYLVFLLEGT